MRGTCREGDASCQWAQGALSAYTNEGPAAGSRHKMEAPLVAHAPRQRAAQPALPATARHHACQPCRSQPDPAYAAEPLLRVGHPTWQGPVTGGSIAPREENTGRKWPSSRSTQRSSAAHGRYQAGAARHSAAVAHSGTRNSRFCRFSENVRLPWRHSTAVCVAMTAAATGSSTLRREGQGAGVGRVCMIKRQVWVALRIILQQIEWDSPGAAMVETSPAIAASNLPASRLKFMPDCSAPYLSSS